jgi:hypothetical protein
MQLAAIGPEQNGVGYPGEGQTHKKETAANAGEFVHNCGPSVDWIFG